eukprot:1315276-Amphidinium_carterae.5
MRLSWLLISSTPWSQHKHKDTHALTEVQSIYSHTDNCRTDMNAIVSQAHINHALKKLRDSGSSRLLHGH